jgi:chromosome segregation ATPase
MAMSIDVSQLEVVKTFSGFLQIMQEPDKYKDLLKETDRLIKEQRALLGPVQTKEQADAYYADAQAKIAVWTKEDLDKQQKFETYVKEKNEEIADTEARVQSALQSAQATLLEANDKLKDAKTKQAFADAQVVAVAAQRDQVNQAFADLDVQKQVLQEKMDKVKKMLGEV